MRKPKPPRTIKPKVYRGTWEQLEQHKNEFKGHELTLTVSETSEFPPKRELNTEEADRSTTPAKENPLLKLIGIGRSGKGDIAENHDDYLYGKDET